MKGMWVGYDVGCTVGLTLGHGAWQIDHPINGSHSFQPVGQWMGYSFTDLGAEGCCRSLNALFELYLVVLVVTDKYMLHLRMLLWSLMLLFIALSLHIELHLYCHSANVDQHSFDGLHCVPVCLVNILAPGMTLGQPLSHACKMILSDGYYNLHLDHL